MKFTWKKVLNELLELLNEALESYSKYGSAEMNQKERNLSANCP